MENVHNEHDVGYKYLLSTKQVFLQLLRTFVNKGWVDQIDATELEFVNKSFIMQEFEGKEADLVYKLKFNDQEIVFYVLMELQSTVDYRMPFRLLIYMTEIWREIIKDTDKKAVAQKGFRLPVVVPIVLYNGKPNWTAPLEFKGMLTEAASFEEQVLNFKYILLDVNRYDEEKLLGISNLISSVFYLDQETDDTEEFFERLRDLADALKNLSPNEFGLFKNWFRGIIMKRFPKGRRKEMEKVIDKANTEEVDVMISGFERNIKRYQEEGMEKANQKGLKKGLEQGLEQGKKKRDIEIAKRMLAKGMEKEEVTDITDLSLEEVEKLIESIN